MKKLSVFVLGLLLCALFSVSLYADEIDDYKFEIVSSLEQTQNFGITSDNLSDIDSNAMFEYILSIISECLKAPSKIIIIIIVFAIISRIIETVSDGKTHYQDILVPVCLASLCPYILSSFEDIIAAMNSVQGFLAAYVPIFASVISASGNIAAATSYNAILLYASQGATLASTVLLKPLLGCMLVATVIHAVNPEMPDISSAIRKLCVTLTGLIMCIFLGVIGLQGIVGRAKDSLTVKAGKYLVSSFVPIIGGALNESYRTVSAGLSSIRSLVGAFGVVILVMIFLTPIISAVVYRWTMTLCEFICGILSGGKLRELAKGISEVYMLLSIVMTIYMLMLVIATGALIALGGEANI